MRDELLSYYERELTFLRQMGAEFAEKYPKVAARLLLEPNRCEDPHVERMIEAFSFLAARVHLKIDDEFPEITHALLHVLYPHVLRPIPSMTVVQYHLDPEQGKQSAGFKIPRNTVLYSRPVDGEPLKFRSAYDCTLWPVRAASAEWKTPERINPPLRAPGAVAALRIELECLPDVTLQELEMDSLRFYLNGESNLIHTLYELLNNNATEVIIRDPARKKQQPLSLPGSSIRPVGFEPEEAILPYDRRSFAGYRLLQEYFAFPEKFFFLDFTGLRPVWASGFQQKAELIVLIRRFERADRQQNLEVGVSSKTLALGCAPIVNLFRQTAEPVLVDHTRFEYPVIPDVRRRNYTEVFSVDEVVGTAASSSQVIRFEPFFSYRHGKQKEGGAFWYANRKPSTRPHDSGTEVDLTLVDLSGRPANLDVETLTVRLTCTNRDLPSRAAFGSETGDFEIEGGSALDRIIALKKPTDTLRPPLRRDAFWPFISQISLNYLSLVEEGKEALQEMLRLYNFSGSIYSERQIQGISQLTSQPHFARVISEYGITMARGTRVEMTFDEEQFVGGGVFLFAAVLERFLGLYVTMNSFSQLRARTLQRKEILREWAPRAGRKILL